MFLHFRSVAARQRHALSFHLAGISSAPEGSQARLAERGYVKGLHVLDRETVVGLQKRLPLLFRGEFDTGVYPDEMHWREGISREDAPREVGEAGGASGRTAGLLFIVSQRCCGRELFHSCYADTTNACCLPGQQIVNAWKADRTVAAVVLSEPLGRLAASLAGWDSARVAQDDVVWKPPGSGPVAYHQDSAYISRQFIPVSAFGVTVGLLYGHVWVRNSASDCSTRRTSLDFGATYSTGVVCYDGSVSVAGLARFGVHNKWCSAYVFQRKLQNVIIHLTSLHITSAGWERIHRLGYFARGCR